MPVKVCERGVRTVLEGVYMTSTFLEKFSNRSKSFKYARALWPLGIYSKEIIRKRGIGFPIGMLVWGMLIIEKKNIKYTNVI